MGLKEDFKLGNCLVQPTRDCIKRDHQLIHLEPKMMAVLLTLVAGNGELVLRDDLMDAVWPNQLIGGDVLNTAIAALRKALGDDRKNNTFIETIPRKGYRLVQTVQFLGSNKAVKAEIKPVVKKYYAVIFAFLALFFLLLLLSENANKKENKQELTRKNNFSAIAVLPFKVFAEDQQLSYFSDGLVEEIIHQLALNGAIPVIARTSSFKFRQSNEDIRKIAEQLSARYIIEGSVRNIDNVLRITVQLIDARTNTHLWSRVFDDQGEGLLTLQEEISQRVNDLLPTENRQFYHSPVAKLVMPKNKQAYQLFLQGQSYMHVGDVKSYLKAEQAFFKVIDLEPSFYRARIRLAAVSMLLFQFDHSPLNEAVSIAHRQLDLALATQPNSAEAYATKGLVYTYLKDYIAAEKSYIKALQLQPNLRFAQHNYGFMLWRQSRFKEALIHLETALSTNPLSKVSNFLVAETLASLGKLDLSEAQYQRCESVIKDYFGCYAGLANIYILKRQFKKAKKELDMAKRYAGKNNFWYNNVAIAYNLHTAHNQQAELLIARSKNQMPNDYSLLKNEFLLRWQEHSLVKFRRYIESVKTAYPADIDVLAIEVLLSFTEQKNCTNIISFYQNNYLTQVKESIWDIQDGISHGLNYAQCLFKVKKIAQAEKIILGVEHWLAEIKLPNNIAGLVFIRLKIAQLKNETEQAKQQYERLKSLHWIFFWRVKQELKLLENTS